MEEATKSQRPRLPLHESGSHEWKGYFFSWFDDWLDQGKLIDITGDAGTMHFGVPRHTRVSDMVSDGSWRIRGQRSRLFPLLHRLISEAPIPHSDNGTDISLWRHSDNQYKDHFSSAETWQQLRDKRETVPWCKVVWFPQEIPRYSFITWLAVKNRLATGDIMRNWGMQQHCTLCGNRMKREIISFSLVLLATRSGTILLVVCLGRV